MSKSTKSRRQNAYVLSFKFLVPKSFSDSDKEIKRLIITMINKNKEYMNKWLNEIQENTKE
jgi:hypothetical protein